MKQMGKSKRGPTTDRGVPCLPRIGMCCAYHGSGCAVPTAYRGVPCLPRIGMCRAYRVSGCAVPTAYRGVPCLPRIGMCCAYHGSGCAVPAVPFTSGPDTRRVVKNRVDPSTSQSTSTSYDHKVH